MPLAPWIEELGAPRGHGGLRRHELLPGQLRDARADGGLPGEDLPPQRGRPVPPAGHLGTEGRRDRRAPRRRATCRGSRAQFAAPPSSYPALPLVAGRRARHLRRRLPPRQLHDVPAPHAVLPERALRARPAPPARRSSRSTSSIVVSTNTIYPPEPDRPVPATPDQHAFGNYRDLLEDVTLNPGDGRVPQHGDEHQERPQRELRPRDPPALLDRHGAAQPGRHDAERPGTGCPLPTLRPDRSSTSSSWSSRAGTSPRSRAPAPNGGDDLLRLPVHPMSYDADHHDTDAKTLFVGFLPNERRGPSLIPAGQPGDAGPERARSTPSSTTPTSGPISPGSSSTAS